MVDINQRSLFRDPYWERGNPYVDPQARQHIDNAYGTQLPQLAVGNAVPSPVQPQGPKTSQPLPSQQGGIMNALGLPKSDVNFNLGPNVVDQGIQSLSNIRIGATRTPEQWDKAISTVEANDPERAELTRQALRNLDNRGDPRTAANVNNEVYKLRAGLSDQATPVGEDDPIDTYEEPANESTGPIATSKEEVDIMAMTKGYDGQRPDETLEEFAKRIGVQLSDKPYDNWDYIRDMSAGLLASKEDNFFGALGDAALLSNAQRDKAETSEDSKRTQLAVAKWRSDDEWDKLAAKNEAAIHVAKIKEAGKKGESKLGTAVHSFKNRSGTTTKLLPIISGAEYYPQERIVMWNGIPTLKVTEEDVNVGMDRVYKNKQEIDEQIDTYMQQPDVDGQLKYVAENTYVGGELLARWKQSDDFQDVLRDIRESGEEGAEAYAKALSEGDGQTAFQLANAIAMQGGVAATLKDRLYTGLFTQMSPGEQQELKDTVNKIARKMGRNKLDANPENPMRAIDLIKPATSYVMKNMNWDENGILKFGVEYSQGELNNFRSAFAAVTDETRNKGWLKNLFTKSSEEFPEDHVFNQLDFTGTPMHRPDESSIFNKSQWELLPENQRQMVEDTASKISSTLQRDFNIPENAAINDVMISIIDSNSIGGGEDVWGWNNQESTFRKPDTWIVEPVVTDPQGKRVSRKALRADGYMWNGFKGEYFTFVGKGDSKTATRRQMDSFLKKAGYNFTGSDTIEIE